MRTKKFIKSLKKIDWKSIGIGILLATIILSTLNLCVFPELTKSELRRLQEAINACPYSCSEAKENLFDCSNMASMLLDWLEQKYGYESWIVIFSKIDRSPGHCLVMALGHLIEPTTKTERRSLEGGQSRIEGELIFYEPNLADGTYSNNIRIISGAQRLTYGSIEEWQYPKRW